MNVRLRFAAVVISLIFFTSCFFVSVSAHPGDTDSNGGHTNSFTGEYHYHHGQEAHDHYDIDGDGIADCPYNFADKSPALPQYPLPERTRTIEPSNTSASKSVLLSWPFLLYGGYCLLISAIILPIYFISDSKESRGNPGCLFYIAFYTASPFALPLLVLISWCVDFYNFISRRRFATNNTNNYSRKTTPVVPSPSLTKSSSAVKAKVFFNPILHGKEYPVALEIYESRTTSEFYLYVLCIIGILIGLFFYPILLIISIVGLIYMIFGYPAATEKKIQKAIDAKEERIRTKYHCIKITISDQHEVGLCTVCLQSPRHLTSCTIKAKAETRIRLVCDECIRKFQSNLPE